MNLTETIFNISISEADRFKYLPYNLWIGFCAVVFDKAGVPQTNPIPEEYFDAVIDGIIESFFGGCEPEDIDHEQFDNTVNKIKHLCWVLPTCWEANSPYRDKNIPYLGYVNKLNKLV